MQVVLLAFTIVACLLASSRSDWLEATVSYSTFASVNPNLLIKPVSKASFDPVKAMHDNHEVPNQSSPTDEEPVFATLPQISRATLACHFGLDGERNSSLERLTKRFKVGGRYEMSAGLFVTLVKNGKTRACWGSLNPLCRDLVRATIYTTEDALKKDFRYPPIRKEEVNSLHPQITVVRRVEPIQSIERLNPLRDGLLVRSGGRSAILLPGEARDAHYQLVKCKLKAGIPSNQNCQLYRVEADVYR